MSGFIPQMAGAFDDDNRLQSHPFFCLMQGGQLVERERPTGANTVQLSSKA